MFPLTVTVTGSSKGEGAVEAKSPDASLIFTNLMVAVKDRKTKVVAIHAITEGDDDVQNPNIPPGRGQPGQICVSPGPNGTLETTARPGDTRVGNNITTGADGICQTPPSGDDVPVIELGKGKPNVVCVTSGTNGRRDTVPNNWNSSGDDVPSGESITTGADGICQTQADSVNGPTPTNVPSQDDVEDYLHDIWGSQANVWITVVRSDHVVNYDFDLNSKLSLPPDNTEEIVAISDAAHYQGADIDMYFVKDMNLVGYTLRIRGEGWIRDAHSRSAENVTAHEVGHALGQPAHASNCRLIMYGGDPIPPQCANNPCLAIKLDWDKVNP
jgi:hypothetical protein